jgi:hypothetical protein
MRKACLLSLLIFTSPAFAGYDSAYTTLAFDDPKRCNDLTEKAVEGEPNDSVELVCEGYGDYKVNFAEGDLRSSVGYAKNPAKECFRWQSFAGFNAAGKTVEWRLKDGDPIATILRWTVSYDPNDSTKTKDWLVVSKLSDNGSCHMGYVEGGYPKANEKARWLADTAAEAFICDVGIPTFYAKAGTVTQDITSSSDCRTE